MKLVTAIARTSLMNVIQYPAQVGYFLTLSLIRLVVMIYLWLSVLPQQGSLAGFDLPSIISYYFVAFLLSRLHTSSAFWLSDLIKTGNLAPILLKPVNFLFYVTTTNVSRKLGQFAISLPVILLLAYFVKDYLIPGYSYLHLLMFLISVGLSILIANLISTLLGLVSFWTYEIGSVIYFYYTFVQFVGGGFLPISFFPQWLQRLLAYLPFSYLYNLPASIYLGHLTIKQAGQQLLLGSFWLLGLLLIYQAVWHRGVKRYTAWGG